MSVFRLLLCCCLGWPLLPLWAAEWIQPGEPVSLGSGEGLVVIGVDSDQPVKRINLERVGSTFGFPELKDLKVGYSLRVLVLPAGEYRVNKAFSVPYEWELATLPNARFNVEAGRVNYVGELTLRGWYYRTLSIRNNGLQTRWRLDMEYPGLSQRWPWRLGSQWPDDYMALLADAAPEDAKSTVPASRPASAAKAGKPAIDARLPTASSAQRQWAKRLFAPRAVHRVELSPAGEHALEYRQVEGKHQLHVTDLAAARTLQLFEGNAAIDALEWLDARHLVLTQYDQLNWPVSYLIALANDGTGASQGRIPGKGTVLWVDPRDGSALYAKQTDSAYDPIELYRVNLLDGRKLSSLFRRSERLLGHRKDDRRWLADPNGALRMVEFVDFRERNQTGWYETDAASGARMHQVTPVKNENASFQTVGFGQDGSVLALTNQLRGAIELVRFDPFSGTIGETVFRRPGVDLQSVVLNHGRAVVGVRFVEEGQLKQRLFEASDERLRKALSRALPKRRVELSDQGKNGNRLVYSEGSTDAGTWYVHNRQTRQLRLLAAAMPGLENVRLADTERLLVKAEDGFEIEAFLTRLPATDGRKQPLLVMPHGGPIGVFDLNDFSAEAQYFAQLGYAVLRVNYRGSGQRDKAFAESGMGQWGQGIEADIERVVDTILKRPDLDRTRVVALGTSYGGYSATMLSLKNPDRYRAAVAIAAPTDLLLSFTSGDTTNDVDAQERLTELIGDPRPDPTTHKRVSPVYRHADIQRPLLLVHDQGDQRVPIEHALRLKELLRVSRGVELPMIETADNQHGIGQSDTAIAAWPRIAAFLDQALAGEGPWAQEMAVAAAGAP